MSDGADVPRIGDAVPERLFTLIGPEKPPSRRFQEDPALTAWRVGQIRAERRRSEKPLAWGAVPVLPGR